MDIQHYQPSILSRYINKFYIYRFGENIDIQLFPKGVFEIVFQSSDCFLQNTSYSSGWKTRPKDFIGGLHNKSYHVKSSNKDNYCMVVEFKPHAAKYFIPQHLHDFQNNVIDIFEIWGDSVSELSQKLSSEKNDQSKIQCIESFLLGKYIDRKYSAIDKAVNLILDSKGFIEVNKLAKNIALSNAQFRKRFNEEVGISPSQYCKVIRVRNTLDILAGNTQKSLTEITGQLGYFDQSHFIKDFKSVTGRSPKTFTHLAQI